MRALIAVLAALGVSALAALAEALRLPAPGLRIGGPLARTLGDPCRPVPPGPGLLAHPDRRPATG